MSKNSPRPLRRDAERNLRRLLAAAEELFAQRGLEVTLNDIAHHAGVGVGTAYRRFPNKEAVVEALFETRLEEVATVATAALEDPDPWHGFVTLLERSLEMQRQNRGLKDIMTSPDLKQPRLVEVRDRIAPLIEQIIDRAKAQGTLRSDFAATDAIMIQLGLATIMDSTRELSPELYQRYFAMFLDGIRTDGQRSALPLEALSRNDTHRIITKA